MYFTRIFEWLAHFARWLTLPGPGLWVGLGLAALLIALLNKGGWRSLREHPTDRGFRIAGATIVWLIAMVPFVVTPDKLSDLEAAQQAAMQMLERGTVRPLAGGLCLGAVLLLFWPRRLRVLAISPLTQLRRGLFAGAIWIIVMAFIFLSAESIGAGAGSGDGEIGGGGAENNVPLPMDIVFEPIEDQPEFAERADALVILFPEDPIQHPGMVRREGGPIAANLSCIVRDELSGREVKIQEEHLDRMLAMLDVALVACLSQRSKPPLGIAVMAYPAPGEFVLQEVRRVASKHLAQRADGTPEETKLAPNKGELEAWLLRIREKTAKRDG